MRDIACLLALSLTSVPAWAAAGSASRCAHAPLLAEPWTSWGQSGRTIAGGEAMSAPRLLLGKPVLATLRPSAQVRFPVPPSAPPRLQGGLFTLALKKPTRVGIALSATANVQIVTAENIIASTGADSGPDCSGIHAIIWFDLSQGLHLVQISGAKTGVIRIMAADAAANQP